MKRLFALCLILSFFSKTIFAQPAVTYGFSYGRFGDNLISYLHAKWIAFFYEIPLVYIPFPYSSELVMDQKEYKEDQLGEFTHRQTINHLSQLFLDRSSTLYICPYFWELDKEMNNPPPFHFNVDWKNLEFRNIVRAMISPKNTIELVIPPEDKINIAIHVREGGGYDDPIFAMHDPTKAPPIHFYVDSLLMILPYLKGKQIHCHVFTDAREPINICNQIRQYIPCDDLISFSCREKGNYHDANVLEDFFSLFNFDILIRPQSNFSIVPSLIKDYAITCCPVSFSTRNDTITIDRIKTTIDERLLKTILERAINVL